MKKIISFLKNKYVLLILGVILLLSGVLLNNNIIVMLGGAILLPLISIFFLFAFLLNPYCQYKNVKIFKGFHRRLLSIPLCIRFFKNKGIYISKNIKFTTSCVTNENHINKIYGFTVSNLFENGIHENSFRFGWLSMNNEIKLMAYYYVDGVRSWQEIRKIEIGESYSMTLYRTDEFVSFKVYNIKENKDNRKINEIKIPFKNDKKYGKLCHLYYGGETRAPHTISLKLF